MLVWCMLVVGLYDEIKTSMHRQYLDMTCFAFTGGARTLLIMLISQGIQCLCFTSNFNWYLTNHGAKHGIFGALRLVSRFKGPSLIPQHHLVDITLPQLKSMHMCKLQSKLLAHMQGEQLVPYGIHETCPYLFTHGKYAWASNMDSIKFQLISLRKGCHQLLKGILKDLVWL